MRDEKTVDPTIDQVRKAVRELFGATSKLDSNEFVVLADGSQGRLGRLGPGLIQAVADDNGWAVEYVDRETSRLYRAPRGIPMGQELFESYFDGDEGYKTAVSWEDWTDQYQAKKIAGRRKWLKVVILGVMVLGLWYSRYSC